MTVFYSMRHTINFGSPKVAEQVYDLWVQTETACSDLDPVGYSIERNILLSALDIVASGDIAIDIGDLGSFLAGLNIDRDGKEVISFSQGSDDGDIEPSGGCLIIDWTSMRYFIMDTSAVMMMLESGDLSVNELPGQWFNSSGEEITAP